MSRLELPIEGSPTKTTCHGRGLKRPHKMGVPASGWNPSFFLPRSRLVPQQTALNLVELPPGTRDKALDGPAGCPASERRVPLATATNGETPLHVPGVANRRPQVTRVAPPNNVIPSTSHPFRTSYHPFWQRRSGIFQMPPILLPQLVYIYIAQI